jgi:hypothetical protein
MKFKSEPNLYVRISNKIVQRTTGLKSFKFDDKGEYETENSMMINVLSQNFKVIEEVKEELFQCKKCEFETDNKGELLAHYRQHKKED